MLEKKSMSIINLLISEEELTLGKIIRSTGYTKKQITYSIDRINDFLDLKGIGEIDSERTILAIDQDIKDFFIESYLNGTFYKYYIMDADERSKYIFFLLIYRKNEYLSVNHFLDALKVGKTTFMADLKNIQNILLREKIEILNNRQDGYFLAGNEFQIRYLMMRVVLQDFSSVENAFFYNYFFYNEDISNLHDINKVIEQKLDEHDVHFIEHRLKEFTYTFAILLPRLNDESPNFYENYNFYVFMEMKEYEIAKEILESFNINNKYATLYICSWILSLSLGNIKESTYDRSIILEIVERMTNRFELLSGIRFTDKDLVIENLYSHFRSVYYRLFFKIPIVNQSSDRLYQEYPEVFKIVDEVLKPISALFEFPIPKEEIAYLTMHFIAAIKEFDEKIVDKKTAVVVCPNGIGSSAIVIQELGNLFPEYVFLGPYDTDSLINNKMNFDMIFSTVQNLQLYSYKKPVFIVNPIMSAEERYNLMRKVYAQEGTAPLRFPRVTELISIISKNASITNKVALEKELYTYLSSVNSEMSAVKTKNAIQLSDIVKESYIQFGISATTFDEVLRKAAIPLITDEIINEDYINSIIESSHSNNSFMMIADLVSLPHTKPQFGARDLGISIVVLDKPLLVEKNTKVKYIFLLSAIDNKKHLTAISQLVNLLENKEFYKILDSKKIPKDIHDFIIENQNNQYNLEL